MRGWPKGRKHTEKEINKIKESLRITLSKRLPHFIADYKIRVCIICNKEYKPTTSRQKRCSTCGKKYWKDYYAKSRRDWGKVPEHKSRINKRYFERKIKAHNILGKTCRVCGFSDHRALQIDHISGGGNQERITSKKDYHWNLYKFIREQPEEAKKKYQLLCANCNWIKKWENKEHTTAYLQQKRQT